MEPNSVPLLVFDKHAASWKSRINKTYRISVSDFLRRLSDRPRRVDPSTFKELYEGLTGLLRCVSTSSRSHQLTYPGTIGSKICVWWLMTAHAIFLKHCARFSRGLGVLPGKIECSDKETCR